MTQQRCNLVIEKYTHMNLYDIKIFCDRTNNKMNKTNKSSKKKSIFHVQVYFKASIKNVII